MFALYVMIYTTGRGWIEALRIDTIELDDVLGLRWGVWMSIILFVGALAYFVVAGRRHRPPDTREPSPYVDGPAATEPGTDSGPAPETAPENDEETDQETDAEAVEGNVRKSSQPPPE